MEGGGREPNWSEAVEDLVDRGDVDGAISVLESVVSRLQTLDPSDHHASQGRCLQADEIRARALLLRTQADRGHHPPPTSATAPATSVCRDPEPAKEKIPEQDETNVPADEEEKEEEEEDDWEAIADRTLPNVGVSRAPQEDQTDLKATPRRRGRGSFFYKKDGLYSDQPYIGGATGNPDSEEESSHRHSGETSELRKSRFGTSHVLVLYDFPPDTQTTDLEKLYEGFKDRGFTIRWVSDTCALAVFRTPSIANEALTVRCPFRVRGIDENDSLLGKLSAKDLEPPQPRPRTSVRTARRLIAHGMGLKPQTDVSLQELRVQEEARRNRIQTRQIMRDDAWGSDVP